MLIYRGKSISVGQNQALTISLLCFFCFKLSAAGFDVSTWKSVEASTARGLSEPEIDLSNKSNGLGPFFIVGMIALVAIGVQAFHKYLEAPIVGGSHLLPGSLRSQCGVVGYLPKFDFVECESSFLKVNNDGTVSLYDEDHELAALLAGDVCKEEGCVDGLEFKPNGMVYIGGKRVRTAQVYKDKFSLSPWPFADAPKLGTKRVKLNK